MASQPAMSGARSSEKARISQPGMARRGSRVKATISCPRRSARSMIFPPIKPVAPVRPMVTES